MFGKTSVRNSFVFRGLSLLSILTLLAIAVGCGGSGSASGPVITPSALGAVQVQMGDAPADSVLSFELTISKLDLQPQSGAAVTVVSTPEEIELTHLSGTLETLVLTKVPTGTYTGAAITVTKAEMTYIPAGATAPVKKQFALNKVVNVTISPALNVGVGSAIVNIDLNLAQSITFDANGNPTNINPMFTITTAAVTSGNHDDEEHGMMEDTVGQVTATTAASGSTLASFTITPRIGGQPQTYFVNSSTKYDDGLAQFSDLKANMMVKVDASTQTDGSLLATKIEMLEASEGLEAEGIVMATTGSPVTSFQLLVHDGSGSTMSSAVTGTTVTVNVGNAVFRAPLSNSDDSHLLNGLPFTPTFDATTLSKGQSVEADASGQMPSQGTINASKIQLRRQSLNGTVGAATAGSNATFSLLLDADSAFAKLTGVSSIGVYQVSSTKLKGVSGATQGSKVKVRGLIFFDGSNYQFVAATIGKP